MNEKIFNGAIYLKDVNYPYAGSTNQCVIDVKKSLEQGEVVLYCK